MFFFFKQKTAYEMRISDWSSDVCSSDLIALPLIGAYQAANALTAAGLVIATGGEAAPTLANLARLQPVRGRLERAVIARSGAPVYVDYAHTPDAIEEIGRASCRERVCQYV